MKKNVSLLLCLAMIALGTVYAFADGSVWYCPTCGIELSGDYQFCYNDGTARPDGSGTNPNPGPNNNHSWPTVSIQGSYTSFNRNDDPEYRFQARSGPGKSYCGVGSYKIKKVSSAKILFREGGYAYIDLNYPTVGHRCLYVLAGMLSNDNAQQMNYSGISATATGSIIPRYGPGMNYDSFEEASISSGTSVTVFFECNGWVFAEFNSLSLGTVRAWLPADQVR